MKCCEKEAFPGVCREQRGGALAESALPAEQSRLGKATTFELLPNASFA